MKFLSLLGTIAVTLGVSAAQSSSCTAYSGTACSSVFGAANITNVGGVFSDIATTDSLIELAVTTVRDNGFSEACQNYIRITQCLAYTPCSGTAWCGSMSPDDLTAALTTACTSGGNQATLTPNYYQGSSSTGTVGSGLACQDVTLTTTGSAAGTMKMSVMGAALVAISLSIGLLL